MARECDVEWRQHSAGEPTDTHLKVKLGLGRQSMHKHKHLLGQQQGASLINGKLPA